MKPDPVHSRTTANIARAVAGRLLTLAVLARSTVAAEVFPFVLPWDDATPSIVDLSSWNEKPAGKDGFITAKNGHLYKGEKRIRFFGVNMAFGGNFPKKDEGAKIAARLAKFGINCVRFHHMDMLSAPGGIFAKDGKTLDPEQLEKLDAFVAALKARGIYTNLNLHVSRTYPDRPRAEKEGNSNFDKGVDNFSAAMIELQKEYARALLTHVNPYTGTSYAREPAVAFVEINNENALLDEWHGGRLDRVAEPYRAELSALWTQWLRRRHGSAEKLSKAWAAGAREPGPELLKNGRFEKGAEFWQLEQHGGAVARAEAGSAGEGGAAIMRVRVEKAGGEKWHVQFGQSGLQWRARESYLARFRARSSVPAEMTVNASQAHEPWSQVAAKNLQLTPAWKAFVFAFTAPRDEENGRLMFSGMGGTACDYEIAEVSLRVAGHDGTVAGSLESGIPAFTRDDYAGRTAAARDDWILFLWQLEERYWSGMKQFIREDLGCGSLILGTQLGWSPFPIQEQMDVIDSHAYWQHPHFPRRQWDMNDWTIKNLPMAGAPDGGTLPRLALQRVADKPYLCTEYNHSAPNQFGSETFPLLCAYAALQDWDGVFAFAYSHRTDDWDKRYFPSFFDIDQHPTKMATLPASLAMFLRSDVARANGEAIAPISLDQAIERVSRSGPRLNAEQFGVPGLAAFVRRVGVRKGDPEKPVSLMVSARRIMSDTSELVWDTENRVVLANTPRSKMIVGALQGRPFTLGDIRFTPGKDQAWACIQLTVITGDDFRGASRILVTATGIAENSGMKWRDAAKTSVGKDWGNAPSLVEGISATIELPNRGRTKAWALDERGQRRVEVPLIDGKLRIGPEHRTLWYEVGE